MWGITAPSTWGYVNLVSVNVEILSWSRNLPKTLIRHTRYVCQCEMWFWVQSHIKSYSSKYTEFSPIECNITLGGKKPMDWLHHMLTRCWWLCMPVRQADLCDFKASLDRVSSRMPISRHRNLVLPPNLPQRNSCHSLHEKYLKIHTIFSNKISKIV